MLQQQNAAAAWSLVQLTQCAAGECIHLQPQCSKQWGWLGSPTSHLYQHEQCDHHGELSLHADLDGLQHQAFTSATVLPFACSSSITVPVMDAQFSGLNTIATSALT